MILFSFSATSLDYGHTKVGLFYKLSVTF